jgi:type VI secretion system secreted protein VgrG
MSADKTNDSLVVGIESKAFSCDDLRVRKLTGSEVIGQLSRLNAEVVCLDREGVDAEAMMGAEVTLVLLREGAEIRRIHGMIAELDDSFAGKADVRTYRMLVVPRAFRLTMVETQDIFIDLTVPEIFRKKLALVGLETDSDFRLMGSYPKRDFVVQYNETDFAFMCRLAEHIGISIFFEHRQDRDVIIFTDNANGFTSADAIDVAEFRGRGEERDVFAIEAKRRLIPTYYAVRDYNYRTPQVDLTADEMLPAGYAGGVIEHGGHFRTPQEGKALAQVRAEERQSGQLVFAGKSDLGVLAAGARFRLEGHPDFPPTVLLVVEVEHEGTFEVAGGGAGDDWGYVNRFRAIPADRTFRPPRITPKPRISGLMTGIIDPGHMGTAQRACLDEEGRYTVRFLFDTAPPGERLASRPVRMLQNHVGENYGTHFPLKPGVEVLLGFVNGDPDRPVIVGAVSNPLKPSPVTHQNPSVHRVKTGSGITVDMIDE